jgi:hypothetical protein
MPPADSPQPLSADFVFEANVTLADRLSLGKGSHGERWVVPITGGQFEGPLLRGEVLSGADWQLSRPDGVMEIDARYAIRVSDGAVIHVRNRGIVVLPPLVKDVSAIYVRTAPSFDAPSDGPHAWLNRALFLGTLELASRGSVRICVFKVL